MGLTFKVKVMLWAYRYTEGKEPVQREVKIWEESDHGWSRTPEEAERLVCKGAYVAIALK